MTTDLTNEEKESAGMTTHNKDTKSGDSIHSETKANYLSLEEQVEDIIDSGEDVAIDRLSLEDWKEEIKQALHKAKEEGRRGAVNVGVLMERERIELILSKWSPLDPMGYGVNLPGRGMHLDDHKRAFAKSIKEALTQDTVHNSKK